MMKSELDELLTKYSYKGVFEVEWTTGGEAGGSCWDGGDSDPHFPLEADQEPDFEALDKFLFQVAPNITFLQYKNLMTHVKVEDRVDHEYYGNYTCRRKKSITTKEVLDCLRAFGYL